MNNQYDFSDALLQISPLAQETLQQLIQRDKVALAEAFYGFMMEDPEAASFLAAKTVQARLKPGLMRWMESLFCCQGEEALVAAMAVQRHIGEVHSRADIPVHLVARGMRLLKHEINQRLLASPLARDELVASVLHVDRLTDIAFDEMSTAFVESHEKGARVDEAFRMFSAGHNIGTERERQLGALLDWENRVLRTLATGSVLDDLPALLSSSFGLWLTHKASLIFDERRELQAITEAVDRIDSQLLPQLSISTSDDATSNRKALMRQLLQGAEKIKFLVAEMFDRLTDLEVGRDALTQLFNRRFLPSILKREIELCRRRKIGFAVLMIDVDYFKKVNDQFGHEVGDLVLQQVATHIVNKVRAGDFAFRYGGEEFLVLLAEVDIEQALNVAEKLCQGIESSQMLATNQRSVSVTISIGIAASDGHPDYERIIERADQALYKAKREGRNRVVVDQPMGD